MTTGTALAAAPEHDLKKVWLDRSRLGPPHLHVQRVKHDSSLSVIRTPPDLTINSLSALYPVAAGALAQTRRILRDDRREGYYPYDEDIYGDNFDYNTATGARFDGPDFTDRLRQHDTHALRIIKGELEGVCRGSMGLNLIRTVFPAEYETLTLEMFEGWWTIFNRFYKLISEADWFPIHWDLLDHLRNGWRECEGNPLHLARYLNEIPILVFGIGEQEEDDFPVLGILYYLLVDHTQPDEHMLYNLGFNTHPDDINPQALSQKLARADLSHLTPPLNRLSEVALMIRGADNPFLDTFFNFDTMSTSEPFYWDTDLLRLQEAWPVAKPVAEAYMDFLDWFRADTHDRHWPADFNEDDKIRAVVETIINA